MKSPADEILAQHYDNRISYRLFSDHVRWGDERYNISYIVDRCGAKRRYIRLPSISSYIYKGKETGQGAVVAYARFVCWMENGPPPTDRHVADHIDRDSLHDKGWNLRWMDQGKNLRRHGRDGFTADKIRERAENRLERCLGSVKSGIECLGSWTREGDFPDERIDDFLMDEIEKLRKECTSYLRAMRKYTRMASSAER